MSLVCLLIVSDFVFFSYYSYTRLMTGYSVSNSDGNLGKQNHHNIVDNVEDVNCEFRVIVIGVQQSRRGWVHYAIHRPEPHIMLFRRPLNYQQKQDNQA